MFSRGDRLGKGSLDIVLKTGKRKSTPNFSAVVSNDLTGFAVVVSKKTARLSVTRHKIKRRVLEALRTIKARNNRAVVLFPKASTASMRYDEICSELGKLLS